MGNNNDATATEIDKLVVKAWETAVDVQKHFNTLEMQIRNFAVTVLTAAVGTAAVVYNQGQDFIATAVMEGKTPPPEAMITFGFFKLSPADLIVIAGLVAWGAFYFMDRWWYHRLLQGAVSHAQIIEDNFAQKLPFIGLSNAISSSSKFRFLGLISIRSNLRIDIFYGVVAVILIILIMYVF